MLASIGSRLVYKGYFTYVGYSPKDRVYFGQIENIKDLVNFEAHTSEGLVDEFKKAVDDYIALKPPTFVVCWTGEFPNLCHGIWEIYKNGEDISEYIPKDLLDEPMGTYGKYDIWGFDDDLHEEWTEYYDGLKCDEWIRANDGWISKFCDNEEEKRELYRAINKQDFRIESCGGCI